MKTPSFSIRIFNYNNNRGITFVFIALLLFALVAFVALAIDLGYMFVTKTQLQNAADSAALAGAARLNGTSFTNQTGARLEAQRFASHNKAAGEAVNIDTNDSNINNISNSYDGDIILGFWDGDLCNPNIPTGQKVNCVKVKARRTNEILTGVSALNKPVNTFFGKVLNISQINITASAIAALTPAKPLPISINEYWLQKDAAARPYPNDVHEYPNSFVRTTNVDGSTSKAYGKIFGILGSYANDNMPAAGTGSKNMNGFVNMDSRTSNHDGSGSSWYDVITGTATTINCTNCPSGFTGPVAKNSGSISSTKFDTNLTYMFDGYPENQILPTAVKEQARSPLSGYPSVSNYTIPTSSCPFATLSYFPSSGNQPLSKAGPSGKYFKDVYPPGTKLVTMVYDGSFVSDTDPNMPNSVTNVGYVLLQIDGYGDKNPKNLKLDEATNDLSTDGSTVYAHAISNMVEPSTIFGSCDANFMNNVQRLLFLGGKVRLVK